MKGFILALLLGASVPSEPTVRLERNTWGKYKTCAVTGQKRFKRDGCQFIFWGWKGGENPGWEVRQWCMEDRATVIAPLRLIRVRCGAREVFVPYSCYSESRTGFDPEVFRRYVTPVNKRDNVW